MLSDWTDENPETIFSNLKQQSDYYNYHQRTAGTFFADTRKQGLRATVADRLRWGRMNMSPTDILGCQRRDLHLPDQRASAGRQLDGAVPARRTGASALHQRLVDDHLRRAYPEPADDRGADRRQRCRAGHGRRIPDLGGRNLRRDRPTAAMRRPTRFLRRPKTAPAMRARRWRHAQWDDRAGAADGSAPDCARWSTWAWPACATCPA